MRNRHATEHLAPSEQPPIARTAQRLCDGILLAGIAITAFLLACYRLGDVDIWWHLRAGEWILENRRFPGLDPFTFGSADRVWIDLHWLFEVVAAVAFRLASMPGVILVGAATAGGSVLVSVWARQRGLAPLTAACWIVPLVLFGYRLDPRPELFSCLFLAVFLATLELARRRPVVVWLLPAVEVLWVNMHGLFVLGPVVYALFLTGQTASRWLASTDRSGQLPPPATHPHHWAAFGAVLAACVLNPYGLSGALLPFELFPKISNPANDYKSYIDEFFSPLEYARRSQAFVHSHAIYYRSLYLLWLGLPLSFVLPALARMVRESASAARGRQADETSLRRANQGLGLALASALVGLAWGAFTVLQSPADDWQTNVDQGLVVVVGLFWLASANWLRRISLRAALLAVLAGLGQLATTRFLQTAFAGSVASGGQVPGLLVFALGCWALAGLLTLQAGGDLFRMLLAAAFACLSFQAVRNLNAFALVAGIILAENLGEIVYVAALRRGDRWLAPAGWISRVALAAVFAVWIGAICTGRWNSWTKPGRRFGVGEAPLEFAHDAARFAGSDGLPDRAIAFDLGMAALYVFHNAPEKKVYMDPRLEVPTLETFKNYVAIDDSLHGRGDMWRGAIKQLGEPLVLLDHLGHTTGEALLLTDGAWRCIYYDSLGSVFVSSHSQVSAEKFPTVDFGRRHFLTGQKSEPPNASGATVTEAEALARLGSDLCRWPSVTWPWRIPAQWLALDRLGQTGKAEASEPDLWALRGRCYWNLVTSFATAPPRPGDSWHNGAAVRWAQATWCFQQALRFDPRHATSLRNLYDTWRARRMPEAQLTAGRELLAAGGAGTRQAQEIEKLEQQLATLNRLNVGSAEPSQQTVRKLIDAGFGSTAADWVQRSGTKISDWDWRLIDQLAATWMHLGHPDMARSAWQTSAAAPSEAMRRSRLADTWWVEGDLAKAEQEYRAAIEAEPGHPDSHWALAMLHADRGDASAVSRACVEALECDLPDPQRDELRAILAIVTRRKDREPAQYP